MSCIPDITIHGPKRSQVKNEEYSLNPEFRKVRLVFPTTLCFNLQNSNYVSFDPIIEECWCESQELRVKHKSSGDQVVETTANFNYI